MIFPSKMDFKTNTLKESYLLVIDIFSNITYPAFSWRVFGKYKIEWKEMTWKYFYSECNSKWPIGVKYNLDLLQVHFKDRLLSSAVGLGMLQYSRG